MEKFGGEKLQAEKKKKPETKRSEFMFEIEELDKSQLQFEKLLRELAPAIRNHEYNLVIGDDVSGRIPTLVIGGLMKEIYREDKVGPPQIVFFTGMKRGRRCNREMVGQDIDNCLEKLIKKKIQSHQARALLVTEHMGSGGTANFFIETFKKINLPCDIAVLTSRDPVRWYRNDFPNLRDVCIYTGGVRDPDRPILFYDQEEIAGVRRVESDSEDRIFTQRRKPKDQESVATARRGVGEMVAHLKQIYDRYHRY